MTSPRSASTASDGIRAKGATIGGHVLSSASNLGLQIGLALTASPDQFGGLVVLLSVYYMALALVRAMVGDVLLAEGPERSERVWPLLRARLGLIVGAAVLSMIAVGLTLAPLAVEAAMMVWAVPVLLMHEVGRQRAWAICRPRLALGFDVVWMAGTAAIGLSLLALGTGVTPTMLVAAWVGGAAMALGWGWAHLASPDGPSQPELAPPSTNGLGAGGAVLAIDANGLPVALASAASPSVAGGLRGAGLVFMPLLTIALGLRFLFLPALRRGRDGGQIVGVAGRAAGTLAGLAIGYSGVVLAVVALVPDTWLGPSIAGVRPWLIAAAVVSGVRAVTMPLGDAVGLSVAPRTAMTVRIGAAAVDWTATIGGALVAGLSGMFVGRAVAAVILLGLWTVALVSAGRRRVDAGASATGDRSVPA